MAQHDYVAPEFQTKAFNCPFCQAYAHMRWNVLQENANGAWQQSTYLQATCLHCYKGSCWQLRRNGQGADMVHPSILTAPSAHPKMPEGVLEDYNEARSVLSTSPRSAAALLRLAIQRLCVHLEVPGDSLDKQIGELVSHGLPVPVAKGLDALRVIGNNAVHPGVLSTDDLRDVADKLFKAMNLIVEKVIAEPAEMAELFDGLPEGAKSAVERRDQKFAEKKAKDAAE